ncbi:MAG: hypothetical protein HYU30_06025 [Chloroflexi bacterium]|nr:hypothetical protein [Chloroflexota bacterium]
MANLRLTGLYALLAVVPLVLAHELMHGFGGALFGHGAVINMNGANPQDLETTGEWVIFALSGTAYLFYVTVVLLLAFRKWRKPYWLGTSLAAGTLHQVGFLWDLVKIGITGSVGGGNGSDPFHAGAILWNNGPLPGGELPWREITFASGWPSFLIITVLIITIATWVCLAWELSGMAASRKRQRTLCLTAEWFLIILWIAAVVSTAYACLAMFIHALTDWEWSAPPAVVLVLGTVLLIIPMVVWVRGGCPPRSPWVVQGGKSGRNAVYPPPSSG